MVIKSLELSNFRNYSLLNLSFDRGTNILYGDNAQGKTNILEAIYLCATTKSHKGAKDKDIVNFNEEEAHIRAYLEKKEDEIRIDMHLRKNKSKGIAIDGTRIKKAAELLGIMNVVFFSPEDLNIIKKGPSERRRFVAQTFRGHGAVSAGCRISVQLKPLQPDCEPAQPAVKGYLPESVPAGYAVGLG